MKKSLALISTFCGMAVLITSTRVFAQDSTSAAPAKPTSAKAAREARLNRPPTWRSAANKAAIAAIVFGVFLGLIFKRPVYVAVIWTVIVFFFYTPLGYWTDRAVYNRRMRAKAKKQGR